MLMGIDKEIVFEYLNELRESGVTNKLEAAAHVQYEFFLFEEEAKELFIEWIETSGERHSEEK